MATWIAAAEITFFNHRYRRHNHHIDDWTANIGWRRQENVGKVAPFFSGLFAGKKDSGAEDGAEKDDEGDDETGFKMQAEVRIRLGVL